MNHAKAGAFLEHFENVKAMLTPDTPNIVAVFSQSMEGLLTMSEEAAPRGSDIWKDSRHLKRMLQRRLSKIADKLRDVSTLSDFVHALSCSAASQEAAMIELDISLTLHTGICTTQEEEEDP